MLAEILLASKGVLAALACESEWMVAVWRFTKIPWQRPRSKLEQVGVINGVCLVNTRQGPWSIRILRTTIARPSRVMSSQLNTGVEWVIRGLFQDTCVRLDLMPASSGGDGYGLCSSYAIRRTYQCQVDLAWMLLHVMYQSTAVDSPSS